MLRTSIESLLNVSSYLKSPNSMRVVSRLALKVLFFPSHSWPLSDHNPLFLLPRCRCVNCRLITTFLHGDQYTWLINYDLCVSSGRAFRSYRFWATSRPLFLAKYAVNRTQSFTFFGRKSNSDPLGGRHTFLAGEEEIFGNHLRFSLLL